MPLLAFFALFALGAGAAHAACTNPAGNERDLIYNSDYRTYQFCNGTSWMRTGPVSLSSPTAANGYFVLTATTYNGNLGHLAGANAKCLTELSVTNTTWKGYATALANNQLNSTKVRAFLCGGASDGYTQYGDGTCNDLKPNITYLFAYAGDASKGGASMTMDSTGAGPGDSSDWSDANHFGIATRRWEDRYYGSDGTHWGLRNWTSDAHCNDWSSASSGYDGDAVATNDTSTGRWIDTSGRSACNNTQHLICYVDP